MNMEEETLFDEIYKKHSEYLIDPDNLEPYLKNFVDKKRDLFESSKFKGKRILITGITGFVGSHLAEKLVSIDSDVEVHGIVRRQSVPIFPNIREITDKISLHNGNITDYPSIQRVIEDIEPHYIFHLAAQSFVPISFIAPVESIQINILGTLNLLEVLRKSENEIEGIQLACSSEEYGLVHPDEVPIKESNPLRPQSPYGVSKLATEHYGLVYHKSYDLPIKITRGFNHTGPRRGLQFVTSVIASQIARNIKTGQRKIKIGNTKPIRDFTDINDMIQGYLLAMTNGRSGEAYNLGHGFGISIENLIKLTARMYNLDYDLMIDKSRYRPAEVNILLADYSKAKKELGFRPQIPLTETMKNIVDYYMKDEIFTKLINKSFG